MQYYVDFCLVVTRFKIICDVFSDWVCLADKNWAYFYKIKVWKLKLSRSVNSKSCSSNSLFYLKNLNFVIFVIWFKVVNCFLWRTPFYMLYSVSYRTLVYLELIIPVQELGTFNTSFGFFFTSLSKSIIRGQKFGCISRTLSSWILFMFMRVSPFSLSENDFRLRIVSIWPE